MFKILPMTNEHTEGVCAVENASFAQPWSKEAFDGELNNENAFYFVAVTDGGEVAGYGGIWCVCGEGQITNIAVRPENRRMHIGSAILEKIVSLAEELDTEFITLEVRVSNTAAQTLYKKFGFEAVSIRKRYYRDNGEDALLMQKKVK